MRPNRQSEQQHVSQRSGRSCSVCGARVTNINPKVTTCDRYCQLAKDYSIDRQRAIRLYPESLESTRVIGPPVWVNP